MEITLYIVLLFSVRGHVMTVTGREFQPDAFASFVGQLVQSESFNVNLGDKYAKETCNGKSLSDCYALFTKVYENEFKTTLLPKVNNEIIGQMNSYNILVLSLINTLNGKSESDVQRIIDAIDFNDSKVYCAIGFLIYTAVETDDILKDYIFFAQFKKTKPKTENLPSLISSHFESRMNDLKSNLNTTSNTEDILRMLLEKKNEINTFSQWFCDLETHLKLKWMTADEWMWNDFYNSKIFYHIQIDGKSLFDAEVEEIQNAKGTIKDRIDKQHSQNTSHDSIATFYDEISILSDVYIVHVLLRRMLLVVASAMQSVYADLDELTGNELKDHPAELKLVLQSLFTQFILFRNSMVFYNERGQNSMTGHQKNIYRNTIIDAIQTFRYLFDDQLTRSNISSRINHLKELLNHSDIMLLNTDNNLSDRVDEAKDILGNNLNEEMIKVNTVFIHLIEVKIGK